MVKMDSGKARLMWRELLDQAMTSGGEVVIERYNKPVATLVNYEVWDMMKRSLGDAGATLQRDGHGDYVPFEEVEHKLRRRGMIE